MFVDSWREAAQCLLVAKTRELVTAKPRRRRNHHNTEERDLTYVPTGSMRADGTHPETYTVFSIALREELNWETKR